MGWKDIVRSVAPVIGTALGGPLGAVAVTTLSNAVLGKPDGSEEELAAALSDPDALVKLKEAERAFTTRMKELDIEVEKLHQADRESAREREIALHDHTPAILAFIVTAGFFGVLAYMLVSGVPKEGGEALLVMLGALGSAWAAVISYYYGSSASGRTKDATLKALTNGK